MIGEIRKASDDLDRLYRNMSSFLTDIDELRTGSVVPLQISKCDVDPFYQTRSEPCHQKSSARADIDLAIHAAWTRVATAKRRLLFARATVFQLSLRTETWVAAKLDRVIWFEALFASIGLAFSTGFVLFGLYGMNLRSGWEDVSQHAT